MKITNRPTYSLGSTGWDKPIHSTKEEQRNRKTQHQRKGSDDFSADGNVSLTYSAASSVNSGGSATAESTDSTFADVMQALDLQDSWELKEFIRKEGVSSINELRSRGKLSSGQSLAGSLAYSTDGESHLEGSNLLQTITGLPMDSPAYDGANSDQKDEPIEGDMGLLFAPAEPGRIKKKKRNKNKSSSTPVTVMEEPNTPAAINSTPQPKKSSHSYRDASPSPSQDTPTKSPPSEKSTPPPHPKRRYRIEDAEQDDEIWYAKWWMFCFADASGLKMMPKR